MDWKEKLSKEWNQIDDIKPQPLGKKNKDICKLIGLYTLEQGQSEEFIDAQKNAIDQYSIEIDKPVVQEYIWVDDSSNDLRDDMQNVLEHCAQVGAHLAIAKLDIFTLDILTHIQDSNVSLVEVDMPEVKNPSDFIFNTMARLAWKDINSRSNYFIHNTKIKIDFGIVKKYFTEKGFGFVGHTFLNTNSNDVFFHIKKIKRAAPDLARKLDNMGSSETIFFWYEFEEGKKGDQIADVLNPKSTLNKFKDDLPIIIEKIEKIWGDLNLETPDWLNQVSVDLMGEDRANELRKERIDSELKRKQEKEEIRKEEQALRKKEDIKLKKLMEEERVDSDVEGNEFKQLIEEMAPLGFTSSSEVSSYIMRNKLGYKYKSISGVVKMELEGNTWDFKGGFPPNIYAQICSELGLNNEGSRARVVGFNPFKNLGD